MKSPSPIEVKFANACREAGIEFEDERNISRYRVDFMDRARMLVIELDGHDSHKTVEDRTYDARRDRKLQREGFTVLRFTGTEITANVSLCVKEVAQTLRLMKPQANAEGAIYVDWLFFQRYYASARHDLGELNPDVRLGEVTLSGALDYLARILQLKGRFDVHLF